MWKPEQKEFFCVTLQQLPLNVLFHNKEDYCLQLVISVDAEKLFEFYFKIATLSFHIYFSQIINLQKLSFLLFRIVVLELALLLFYNLLIRTSTRRDKQTKKKNAFCTALILKSFIHHKFSLIFSNSPLWQYFQLRQKFSFYLHPKLFLFSTITLYFFQNYT